MKKLTIAVAVGLLLTPAFSSASSGTAYEIFKSAAAGIDGDGRWEYSQYVSVSESGDVSSIVSLDVVETRVGENSSGQAKFTVDQFFGESIDDDLSIEMIFEGRTVSGRDYLKFKSGEVWLGIESANFSAPEELDLWVEASPEELGDSLAPAPSGTPLDAITELGEKDAKYKLTTKSGKSIVTAKILKGTDFAKRHPELVGATVQVKVGTGGLEVAGVDISIKQKKSKLVIGIVLERVGDAPSGFSVSVPPGPYASQEDVTEAVGEVLADQVVNLATKFESWDDYFSVQFGGVADLSATKKDKKDNLLWRSYSATGSGWSEYVHAASILEGDLYFVTDDETVDATFEKTKAFFEKENGKKNIKDSREIEVEGERALRIVLFLKKEKIYQARVDFCGEDRCFQLVANAKTQEDAEARLGRMVSTFQAY